MKKVLLITFALLILVGCSGEKGYSKLTEGEDIIFKSPDKTYTKNDLYDVLKVSSEQSIENDLLKRIATKLNVDFSKAEEEAQSTVDMYTSMGYEQLILQQYGSIEAFKEMYMYSGILNELAKLYVEDNYNDFVKQDKPVKMQLARFDVLENAEKLIKDVENGSTFETAAANNGYETECTPAVFLDSDDLALAVKNYLNETDTEGLSKVITDTNTSQDADGNDVTTETYYVVNIVSRNVDDYIDDYKAVKAENVDLEEVKTYMFKNHDIEFYDQDIYEIMKAKYEVLQ